MRSQERSNAVLNELCEGLVLELNSTKPAATSGRSKGVEREEIHKARVGALGVGGVCLRAMPCWGRAWGW